MKNIILKSILFLLLLLLPFVLLNRVVKKITGGQDYYKLHFNELKTKYIHANNIIIGTSKSLHGIQPKLLNHDSTIYFNFSLNGATAGYYKKWYDDLFTPFYPKPKQVIVCADLSFLDNASYWRQYEQDAEYFPAATFTKYLLWGKEINTLMLLKSRFPVTKQLQNIFHLRKESPFRISQYEFGYIPYETIFNPGKTTPFRTEFNLAYRDKFEELIRQLQQNGAVVIFIQMPEYCIQQEEAYGTININRYYDSLSKSLKITFLNYNTKKFSMINRTKEYYSDRVHLNHKGSTVFSAMLRIDLDSLSKSNNVK